MTYSTGEIWLIIGVIGRGHISDPVFVSGPDRR